MIKQEEMSQHLCLQKKTDLVHLLNKTGPFIRRLISDEVYPAGELTESQVMAVRKNIQHVKLST